MVSRRPALFALLAFVSFAGLVTPASAALEFDALEVTAKPAEPGQKKIETSFAFKNTGDVPVTITEVHASCGCTAPDKPKDPVAPGARGAIPVIYAAGEKQGQQVQHVTVKTDDGKEFSLRLVVELPVRVTIEPRLLLFKPGSTDPLPAKVVFGDDLPVTLTDVAVQSPDFALAEPAKLDGATLPLSFRYVGASDKDARASVRIVTKGASGLEHTDVLYLRHRP